MIPLFTPGPRPPATVSIPPKWNYVRAQVEKNLYTAVTYYQQWAKPNRQFRFLTQLLETIDVPMDLPLERYTRYVQDKAMSFSIALGMTSPLSKGRAFHGEFFSKDNTEFFIASDSYFDASWTDDHIRSASPMKFLTHPKSDLDMVLPGGTERYSNETGLVVVLINIAQLAVMWRSYKLTAIANGDEDHSTQLFIERIVLPSMLLSQTEIAFFNRLYRKLYAVEDRDNEVSQRHPFPMLDIRSRTDDLIAEVITNYPFVDPIFDKLLQNTPALFSADMGDALLLPDVAPTAQVEWLLICSRLKAYDFVIKASGSKALAANQGTIAQLLRAFRSNGVGNMMDNNLPPECAEQLQVYLSRLQDLVQRPLY